jgi:serine/threonine protein phosphatase 1
MAFAWLKRARGGEPKMTLRPERPIWAVGDVHGRSDLLRRMVERVLRDAAGTVDPVLVMLGDYVDRGPDSAGVLSFLRDLQATETRAEIVVLGGNHEAMMLDALREPVARGRTWLRYGGLETLESYGITGVRPDAGPGDLRGMAAALRAAMPEGLEAWLGALPLGWRSGNVACVHAGLDPALPPEEQPDEVLLWGHPAFGTTPRGDGLQVVHGHAIVPEPVMRAGRIAVDTGAYRTGRLTAVRIDPDGGATFLDERG